MKRDLLLEIGCENLPPASIKPAFEQLEQDASQRLQALRLPFETIRATGTPRRIVLMVRGLARVQIQSTETVTGPPVSKAYDGDGKPTRAAEGFARSHGVSVDRLRPIETDRGEYLGFTKKLKCRRAGPLLRETLPELIRGIRFPKTMRWEGEELRFARPIRWIVCFLGDSVVRYALAGIKAGGTTFTVPWIRRQGVRVRNLDHYLEEIGRAGVVLDHEERYRAIEALATRAAARLGLQLVADPDLVGELSFMLEDPRPLVGEFDRRYLRLPDEVVITAMKSHQRYLAFRDDKGQLVPRFLTFTEGPVGSPASVRRGNERVLRARLEDALFYWQEDLKAGMDGLAGKLGAIVFLEGLGSLGEKALRVGELAIAVGEAGLGSTARGVSAVDANSVRRAARLGKADLASEMIKDGKEFTLLEGLIGSRYAHEAGESEDIVAALTEQYLPRGPADRLPSTPLGTMLSTADRMDTIVGCFLAGVVPTGSQDPYALRRRANGLLRILEEHPRVRLDKLLDGALAGYHEQGLVTQEALEEVRAALVDFLRARVDGLLRERGVAYDVVAAVTAVSWANPRQAVERARAIEALRGNEPFELLITGAKRVGNILEDHLKTFGAPWVWIEGALAGDGGDFDTGAFVDEAESALLHAVRGAIPRLRDSEAAGDLDSALAELARLGPAIDSYFDEVLVNCDDARLRTNRHHFLAAIFALFSRYADFSQIVEAGNGVIGKYRPS